MEKTFNARWSSGLDFTGTSGEGVTVPMGGSENTDAFRPASLVLAGLVGCTGMDAVSIMIKKRLQIESYEVEAVGTQRSEHPKSFDHIVLEHIIKGTSINDKAVARAVVLSATKYCVVGANLASGDCQINHNVRIVDENGERTCDCITIGPNGKGLAHMDEA